MKKLLALLLLMTASLAAWTLKDLVGATPVFWSTEFGGGSAAEQRSEQFRDPAIRIFQGKPTLEVDPRYPDLSRILRGAPKGLAYAVGTRGLEAVHVEGILDQRSEVCGLPTLFMPHRGKHLLYFDSPPAQRVRLWAAEELVMPKGRSGKLLKGWLKERKPARVYGMGSKPVFGLLSDRDLQDTEPLDGMLFWPGGTLDLHGFKGGELKGIRKGLEVSAAVEGLFALSNALYLVMEIEEKNEQGYDCCCSIGTYLVRLDASGPRIVRAR